MQETFNAYPDALIDKQRPMVTDFMSKMLNTYVNIFGFTETVIMLKKGTAFLNEKDIGIGDFLICTELIQIPSVYNEPVQVLFDLSQLFFDLLPLQEPLFTYKTQSEEFEKYICVFFEFMSQVLTLHPNNSTLQFYEKLIFSSILQGSSILRFFSLEVWCKLIQFVDISLQRRYVDVLLSLSVQGVKNRVKSHLLAAVFQRVLFVMNFGSQVHIFFLDFHELF